jgi:hypothetical protein
MYAENDSIVIGAFYSPIENGFAVSGRARGLIGVRAALPSGVGSYVYLYTARGASLWRRAKPSVTLQCGVGA